jgi:hypothetical protein
VSGREAETQWCDQLGRVLTRQQVAQWLQVAPRQIDRLRVPCLNLGHKTKRFLAADVQAWLETQRRPFRGAA